MHVLSRNCGAAFWRHGERSVAVAVPVPSACRSRAVARHAPDRSNFTKMLDKLSPNARDRTNPHFSPLC
jgi:hypothetical protein